MNLLITGVAGFIGSHFLEIFLKSNLSRETQVVVLDDLRYSGLISNVERARNFGEFEFEKVDISDFEEVKEVFEKHEISDCINFAAESHVDRSIKNAKDFIDSNIVGVFNLLENFKTISRGRFLQISTDEVYGSIEKGKWKESQPLRPRSPYSASKGSADLLVQSYFTTYDLNTLITRCSNNFGPRQNPEKFVPLIITNLIEGRKIPIYGTGDNVRDWIHVEDHCRGILKVFCDGKKGNVYNLSGNRELSNLNLAKKILSIMEMDESFLNFVQDRPGHDFRYAVDDMKIRSELEFRNQVEFEFGLRNTVDWYCDNLEWWKELKYGGQ